MRAGGEAVGHPLWLGMCRDNNRPSETAKAQVTQQAVGLFPPPIRDNSDVSVARITCGDEKAWARQGGYHAFADRLAA